MCATSKEKLGDKRDFLPSSRYDENQEFGGGGMFGGFRGGRMYGGGRRDGVGVTARKSGLFTPQQPMVSISVLESVEIVFFASRFFQKFVLCQRFDGEIWNFTVLSIVSKRYRRNITNTVRNDTCKNLDA